MSPDSVAARKSIVRQQALIGNMPGLTSTSDTYYNLRRVILKAPRRLIARP